MFTTATAVTGILAGAGLAVLGSHLPSSTRAGLATVIAVVGGGLALVQLTGRPLAPLQCDRLTPKRWARQSALGWALRNGASLGLGAFTRIGFWLWYAVPAAAFLSGRPLVGALVYGTYGLVRGLGVWAMIAAWQWRRVETGEWLVGQSARARTLAAAALAALAAFVFVAVGL